ADALLRRARRCADERDVDGVAVGRRVVHGDGQRRALESLRARVPAQQRGSVAGGRERSGGGQREGDDYGRDPEREHASHPLPCTDAHLHGSPATARPSPLTLAHLHGSLATARPSPLTLAHLHGSLATARPSPLTLAHLHGSLATARPSPLTLA